MARALWSEVARLSENRYMREMAEREMARIDEARATGRADVARRRLSTPTVQIRREP